MPRAHADGKGSSLRMLPFVALLFGVTLLAAGLLLTTAAVSQEDQQERTLHGDRSSPRVRTRRTSPS